jgi:hypothetical protein
MNDKPYRDFSQSIVLGTPDTSALPPNSHYECLCRRHLARLEELNAQLARENDRLRHELGKVERAA